jgi:hypothetical protein
LEGLIDLRQRLWKPGACATIPTALLLGCCESKGSQPRLWSSISQREWEILFFLSWPCCSPMLALLWFLPSQEANWKNDGIVGCMERPGRMMPQGLVAPLCHHNTIQLLFTSVSAWWTTLQSAM